jgi:hypothetical protein
LLERGAFAYSWLSQHDQTRMIDYALPFRGVRIETERGFRVGQVTTLIEHG